MADYQKPSWCQVPGHTWTLIEIKNGTEIAQHLLKGACTVIGRAADLVDVELAHESCSRRHARIAFDSRGIPWLRDLGSTHGTIVNKKPLPAAAIGKIESASTKVGSRGVVLFPGDIVQFGASTRLFCVEGPAQFERGAVKALQQQQEAQTVANHPLHLHENDDEPDPPKTLDENSIPPQHYKAWEALKAKRYKQQNLQTENDRIEVKGELTEGQQRQLERNRQRMETLQEEIDEMEQGLLNKIFPGPKGGPKSLFNAAVDDDDVDDRAGDVRRPNTTEAETEDSLVKKWKQNYDDCVTHKLAIARAESRLRMLEEQLTHAADEEERFYIQNDVDLAQDVCKKSKQRLDMIMSEVNETERLLRIVNRKIIADFETGQIGIETMPSPNISRDMPPPPSFAMPPPTTTLKRVSAPSIHTAPVLAGHMPPPEKDVAHSALGVSDGVKISNGKETKNAEGPRAKRSRVIGPVVPLPAQIVPPPTGTLAYLAAPSTVTVAGQSIVAGGKKVMPSDSWESKKDEWRAPVGQDGSGKAKLNNKFAGRY